MSVQKNDGFYREEAMTFLQLSRSFGKKAVLALVIISCFALVAYAQIVAPQQEGKRYGDPGFRGEPINLNVVNADIRDILNYITEQYGVNFVIDKSVTSVPVTVNVSDVPWNVALDAILQSHDLGVQVNGPILRIAQRTSLAQEATVAKQIRDNQLDTSPLYTEFIRLNYARAAGAMEQTQTTSGTSSRATAGAGSFSGAGGDVASVGGAQGGEGLLPIIRRRLSRRGGIEVDARSNTLIITDVRENIDAIRQLVMLLDQPEPQVEIETRIVVASRNFSRDIGVQISAIVLGTRGQVGQFGTLPPGTTTGGTTGGAALNPGGIPTGITNPSNQLASAIPNTIIGLTTGIFGTAQISALLTAGEEKGQAKTIATPRVTALNNQRAEIKSGLQIPVTNVQPGSPGGGAIVATTQYVEVPLRLEIIPQITDMGTIILSVTAENSSLAGGGVISSQSMVTQVMVPDGGTTVVGGVLSDIEGEDQFRTPGLSKVPVLGNLFKRRAIARTTNEILFFITPRIYRPDLQGNPTSGRVSDGTRTTTIIQPVPLGNPPSNSSPEQAQPVTVPIVTPVVPQAAPETPNRP
jgi:type IV pilus assembly protein PilQ